MKKLILLLTLMSLAYIGVGQTTLYSEDFTGQENKGAWGNSGDGITEDLTGVDWTIDISSAGLDEDATTNEWRVVDNSGSLEFQGQDVGGTAYWFTPSIDVSGVSGDVTISCDIKVLGSGANASSEGIAFSYSLDGGNYTDIYNTGFDGDNTNGSIPLTSTFESLSASGIDVSSSNALLVRVKVNANGANDGYIFDNISVAEDAVTEEPKNHVTGFTAYEIGYDQVDLSWNDAIGIPLPDGYVIKANTSETFIDPTDYTDPVEDTDLSDGSALVKVIYGAESHSFTGLSETTQYYFKIWPYTNSGSDIDFKTDGTVPSDNATTEAIPNLIITEIMQNPSTVGDSDGEWFEIYNAGESTVNINGYIIKDSGSDSHTINNGAALNIAPGDYLVLGNNINNGTNGNVTVNYEYSGIILANSDDELIIETDAAAEVDSAAWDGGTNWPNPDGASMTLNPDQFTNNNIGSNWYEARSTYGDGDKGTPGAKNDYPLLTWNGNTDNDWSKAENWSDGIPNASTDVTIPLSATNMPTISTATTVNSIVIENGGSLVGQENLTVNSTATVEKSFTGYTAANANDGWYAVSSPVDGMTISGSDYDPGTNDDLYEYDEGNNMWLNFTGGTFGDANFVAGKGYLVSYETSATKSFESSDFNTTDGISPALGVTNTKWNLVGNPYPSKLTYANINTASVSSPKSLNETTGAWDDLGTEVEVGEGLFVYAEGGTSSLTFNLDDQTHGTTKKASQNYAFLRANFNDGFSVFARFGTDASASQNYEWKHDARYLYPATSIPYLSTITEDEVMASTYVFNDEAKSVVVPLYFSVSKEHEISFNTDGNIGYQMAIEDNIDGSISEIDADNPFMFTALPADDEHRFNLHLTKSSTIGLDENEELAGVHVYANKRNIYFNADENLSNATLTVYNTIGQVVLTTSVESGSEIIRMENRGAYIVKVQSNEGSITEKVIIQ